ncbi:unnamed protein product, partial [Rotaria magnacalcarata]
MSATCYDDPTKDHSEPVASTIIPNNQMNAKACSFYLLSVRLTTGGTGINSDDMTAETNRKHHSCGEHHHHHHHHQQQQQQQQR